jgi:ABC-2 type transport system ATP-binding protein
MIDVYNLTFGYSRKRLLFKDLNLHLKKGHIYGLLGKNGAGKTSLLKCLAGLTYPQDGDIRINGHHPGKRQPSFLEDIFYLPEEIHVPDMTAQSFAKGTAPFYPRFHQGEYEQYLNDFEVPFSRSLSKLSLGQQKKFIISFALACNTSVLIMDEPTNGLDIPSKAKFRKVIASAFSDDRLVVISTHQVRDLDNLIDSVLILNNQQIVLNSSNEELSSRLNFGLMMESDAVEALYAEESFRGIHAISVNKNGATSKPDLELLFNGVVAENEALLNHLNRQ